MSEPAVTTDARSSALAARARRRPEPGFGHVLGAAAGAFAVVAAVAFVVGVAGNDPTAPGVGFDAGLAVAALVLGFRSPGPLRSAFVTIIVLTVPIIWFFALFGSGSGGRSELRGLYLLTLGTYLVLYLAGWTRGRAILLAGALLFLASWVTFEVAGDSSTLVPFQNQVSAPFTVPNSVSGSGSGSSGAGTAGSLTFNSQPNSDDTSIAAFAIGAAFLVVGSVLDRRRLAAAATPFIAIGALEALSGAIVLGGNNSLLAGGLGAVAAGAIVGMVGAQGEGRRGSTWIGVLAIFGGLVAVLVDIAPSSAGAIGGIAFGFAVGLALIATWIAPRLGETDDGGIARVRRGGGPPLDDGPPGDARPVTADAAITAAGAAPATIAPATGPAADPPTTEAAPAPVPGPATELESGPAPSPWPDPTTTPAAGSAGDAEGTDGPSAPTGSVDLPDDRRPSD